MASRQMHGASKMFDFRCHSNRASAFVPRPWDYGATGNADETDESKPNSRVIKTKTIGVMLLGCGSDG